MRRSRVGLASLALVALLVPGGPASGFGRPGSYIVPDVAVQPTPSFAVGTDHVVAIGLDHRVYVAAGAAGLAPVGGLPSEAVPRTVAAGDGFSLVLTYDGRVFGTGRNDHGQLTGSGDRALLAPLSGLPTGVVATDVAAGRDFTLVLGSDGIAYGTGRNDLGQLTGTGDRATLTPLTGLPSPSRVTRIAAGAQHSLVVSGGLAYGTGVGTDGQLGGAGIYGELSPIGVGTPSGTVVTDVAAGATSSYLLTDHGLVFSGGGNAHGQLGTGAVGNAYSFEAPVGLPAHVAALTAGGFDVVAVGDDGTAYVAGADDQLQAGGRGTATTFRPLASAVHQAAPGPTTTVVRDIDGGLGGSGRLSGFLTGQVFASPGSLDVTLSGRVLDGVLVNSRPAATATYAWRRDGVLVPGATGPSLRLGARDGGRTVTLSVRLDRPGFVPQLLASGAVAVGLANLSRPRILGTVRVGARLHADRGTWASGRVRTAVTWLRDGKAAHSGRRYVVRPGDVGHRIAAVVTASRPGFASATARSRSVRAVG